MQTVTKTIFPVFAFSYARSDTVNY